MRVVALSVLLAVGGCAQLFGLEETSLAPGPDAARTIDASIDAPKRECAGGSARILVDNTCYVRFDLGVSYEQAIATCLGIGPDVHLVTIESAQENLAVASLISAAVSYLGATDRALEGAFAWDSGAPMLYTNWAVGEPNNSGGLGIEEDCMAMRGDSTGQWDDRECTPPPPPQTNVTALVCEYIP